MGSGLPAGPGRLTCRPAGRQHERPGRQAAGGPEQFLTEFQASRSYLAGGLRGGGWLDFGQFNWHDVALGRAIRAALGVITPLAAGIAAGHTAYSSFAALGALPAGFVSFRGVSRTRVLAVAATALGMAVSTFAGATTSARPWLLVAEVMTWAYAVGLLAALGPTATAIALQWPVALLISSALPLDPRQAAIRAGLVLAGGLWQGALVMSTWAQPPGPLPPLRRLQAAIVPGPDAASGALFAATDGLVDAVNTVGDILRAHLAPAEPSPAS